MSEPKTCPRHTIQPGVCPACEDDIRTAPNPETMTPDERVAEFERWCGPLWVPFSALHKRMEELLGRPVWRHEFAHSDLLREEVRTRQHPTWQDVIDRVQTVAGDKPVSTVNVDEADQQ